MSADYIALNSTREPFRLLRGNSTLSSVLVVAAASFPWASGGSDAYDPTNSAYNHAVNVYDLTTIVDTTQYTWILLAVKGKAYPMLAKEVDFATFDSLTGGNWAILRRLAGNSLYPIPGI